MRIPPEPKPLSTTVELTAAAPTIAKADETTLADGAPIPDTFPELVQMTREFQKLPIPKDPEARRLHLKRHAEIKRRCHAVQQGPTTTICTTANEQAKQLLHRRNGAARRRDRLAALKKFLGCPSPAFPSLAPFKFNQPPKVRLLQEPEVLEQIWNCRRRLAEAEISEIENFDLAFPETRLAELEHEIQVSAETARLREIADEIIRLRQMAGQRSVATAARAKIGNEFQQVFNAFAALINTTCKTLLVAWENEAKKQEEEWFKAHNLPGQRTALSLGFVEAVRQLPAVNRNSLNYFGVNDVAA